MSLSYASHPTSSSLLFAAMQVAQRAGSRLIPALPNELTDLVLAQISFYDLISAYFVSPAWKVFMNNDERGMSTHGPSPQATTLSERYYTHGIR